MDPVAPQTMDKKPSQRPLQLSTKLDSSKDVCKKGNGNGSGGASVGGRRQQRDVEWVTGGAGRDTRKSKGFNRNGGAGARGGWGKGPNRLTRNREKEGGQVGEYSAGDHNANCSSDFGDYEYYDSGHYDYDDPLFAATGGGGSLREAKGQDITHQVLSWWPEGSRRGGSGGNRRQQQHGTRHRAGRGHAPSYSSSGKMTRKTKERAIQARCQFVVNFAMDAEARASALVPIGCAPPPASRPPSTNSVVAVSSASGEEGTDEDPDTLVSWAAVEEVLVHMTQPTHCPVCLYPPVAPQVTRCGHIYCYPCILHYLALSDHKWRECPICYDMVVKEDLKSAVCVVHPDYTVGSTIQMRLMQRPRQSMLSSPVAGGQAPSKRKIRATKLKVFEILDRERCALEVQLVSDGEQPESCFIEQALDLLQTRQTQLSAAYDVQDGLLSSASQEKLNEACESVGVKKSEGAGASEIPRAVAVGMATLSVDNSTACDKIDRAIDHVKKANEAKHMSLQPSKEITTGKNKQKQPKNSYNKKGKNYNKKTVKSTDTSAQGYTPYESLFELPPERNKAEDSGGSMSSVFSEAELGKSESTSVGSSMDTALSVEASPKGRTLSSSCSFDDSQSYDDGHFGKVVSSISGEHCHVTFGSIGDVSSQSSAGGDATGICSNESLQFELEQEHVQSTHLTPHAGVDMKKSISSPAGLSSIDCSQTDVHTSARHTDTASSGPVAKSVHYFYQASDDSHVYLHPMNMSMVTRQYQHEQHFPLTIEARVVEKDHCVMDEAGRSRWKHLRHLPLCCPYEVVELHLLPPLISHHTLDYFHTSLDRRQQYRAQRAQEEQLIEQRNQVLHDREITSHLYTRVYSATRTSSGGARERTYSSGDGSASPDLGSSPSLTSSSGAKHPRDRPPSFAKMVLEAPPVPSATAAPAWPTLTSGSAQSPSWRSTPSARGGGAWGTPSAPTTKGEDVGDRGVPPTKEAVGGERVVPSYQDAFSLDWDAMLQQPPASGGKKNKKGKKKFVRLPM